MHKRSLLAVVPAVVAIFSVLGRCPEALGGVGQDSCCRPVLPWLAEWETRPGGAPGQTGDGAAPDSPAEGEDSPKEDSDKPKWDVSKPTGPTTEVPIDTDEGTWLSLDVSPDGQRIIFDLLGDLYEIPIAGGDAKAITSGLAWDMQPRYSPDGRFIAFTSDRGGGDNIWVMNRDGTEIRQVTKESFRLLNSPAWAPDGEFIVAQKHFTSKRSLGSGEMWLYHRTGGDGLQMTKKPNEQKNVGEPVFSPDGKYLYYSLDATPGDTFEYDKDSNAGIYAIDRLNRETGEIDRLIGGPGGACRPTPSPDGELMAYVRRIRGESVLYVQELDSGQEWPVCRELERDMQETWAVHGVYPTMAWTPDSKSVVFYARGKIRRVTVEPGDAEVIPFRVKDTRTVQTAVRFPVEVAPAEFEARMLRWVTVSPDGRKVVYEALGKLYVRNLPDGEPQRLTRQDDHQELYPSWSPDSQSVVYTTWSDEQLGEVRITAGAPGGRGRTITDTPGHYVEPVFTPDGRTVVYRRIGGGYIRSRLWQREPGVYRVSTTGGESHRITRRGEQPHFGAEPDRVFLVQVSSEGGKDRRALTSMTLDGAEQRTHLFSENAVEYRVSPDGRWVGFVEGFNAYITPFVPTGREVELSRKGKAIPQTRVSRDAGDNLHWSGDSTKLHWSMGPELYTRDVTESFTYLEGAPEQLPEPAASGLNISFRLPSDVPEGVVALTNARIITMRGDDVIESGTVVVEGNRITAVGRSDEVPAPRGAHVVDCTGLTIMPGLIDVHAHGAQGMHGIVPQRNWINYASLAFGTTTVHDPSNDTKTFFAASEQQRAGLTLAPRLYSTGTILYGAAGWFKAEIDSLEDAQSHLRRMKAVGAFSVKSYNQPRRDQRQQVISGARELGMMVMPEGGALFQHNMTMIVDGHTGIEHTLPVGTVYGDVIQLWAPTGTYSTPTLGVAYGGLGGENYWYQHTNVWENERLMNFVPRWVVDPRARRRQMAPESEYNHISAAGICKKLIDAGGKVQIGAHGQLAGLAAHWELWMLEQGGMTAHEALRCGTLFGAQYLGMDKDLGSIEPGKLADLLVLEKNPLENLRDSERIRYTMLNGRIYDARTLNEVGNHPRERGKLFWELEDAY